MTPQEARRLRLVDAVNKRNAQRACAADFLRRGDTVGVHAKRCVFGAKDPCRREYDPCPVPEATPDDRRMFERTGIGTIYGWNSSQAWQLAGWNITRRKRRRT
jgi:hypothetical protein